jgi:excisionase family DNA binding protein
MSSNIRITKTCEYCNNEFEAKTVTTRYCSHSCNNKSYKQIKKEEKIKLATGNKIVTPKGKLKQAFDYPLIQGKELLTIKETCALLNITDVTLRRWLKDEIIQSSRVGKKHLIKRSNLDNLI